MDSRRCDAERAGLTGCPHAPAWLVQLWEPGRQREKAACGRHLHRVCGRMLTMETQALTLKPLRKASQG